MTSSFRIFTSLRLLVLGCVGAALGVSTSCQRDCGEYSAPVPLELGVTDDLHAVVADPDWLADDVAPFHAVGAGGVIVEVREQVRVHRPVAADLHGVAISNGMVVAVGDGGTVVRAPWDGSGAWEVDDVGVTNDLYVILPMYPRELVLGDDIVLVHDLASDTWTEAPRPSGGWGSLRAGFRRTRDGSYHAFGLEGAAWKTDDPAGEWTRVDFGTDEDLLVAGGGDEFVVGRGGVFRRRIGDEWLVWDTSPDTDFIAGVNLGLLLTADGRVVGTESVAERTLRLAADVGAGMAGLTVARESEDGELIAVIAVGQGGRAARIDYRACPRVY